MPRELKSRQDLFEHMDKVVGIKEVQDKDEEYETWIAERGQYDFWVDRDYPDSFGFTRFLKEGALDPYNMYGFHQVIFSNVVED